MAKSRSFGGLLVLILVLAAAAAGGYYYYQKRAQKPPEFTTVVASRGDIVQVVTSSGDLQPVLTTDVSSQISGQITDVLVDYNSPVKQGDILARIDPATYESRLRQAEAQLANTTANHQLVKVNAERIRTLRQRDLVTQQELDQAEAQLAQADAQLLIQQAAVENAKVDLTRCTIYAPIDGLVLDKVAEVGKMVAASLNAPTLFVIVNDLSRMQIKAAVAEADIGTVEEGQTVNFTVDAFPNRQFRGRVAQIRNSPVIASNVVTYSTIIDVRNDDLRLKPGMTANVSIVVARSDGAIRVPNAALRARIPEQLLPARAAAAGGGETRARTGTGGGGSGRPSGSGSEGGGGREQIRQLMQEAGVSGRPTPDQLAKIQELAKERGIELPAMFGGGRGGNGAATTMRTVYRLVGTAPDQRIEPVNVRLGITDGIVTEALEGLNEGDALVTSAVIPGAPSTAAAQAPVRSPFTGGGGFRR